MIKISVSQLVEAGVHFGHRVSRWNPKMAPYIYGKRNLIHIINLKETVKGLARASGFLANICATGQQVVFVGTKRQIKEIVQHDASSCAMPYVSERWLGGTLTNFQTIHARLNRLEELEEMEKSGKMELYSKKIQASLARELSRIKKNLEGIREMHRLPAAMVVVDPRNEKIAVREANKLGIPVIAILDTDCDPKEVDIPIPANDDAIRSVQVVLQQLIKAVNEGKANFDEKAAMDARAFETEDEFQLASDLRKAQRAQRRGQRGGDSSSRGRPRPGPGGRPGQGGRSGPGGRPGAAKAPAPKKEAPAPSAAPAPDAAQPEAETPAPVPPAAEAAPAPAAATEPAGETAPAPAVVPETPAATETPAAEPEKKSEAPAPESAAPAVAAAADEGAAKKAETDKPAASGANDAGTGTES